MINEGAVSRAKEYLDLRFSESKEATLVEMLWYIDGHDKIIPMLDELNETLRQHASVYVQRADGKIIFAPTGSNRTVKAHELEQAIIEYRNEFAAAFGKLESEKSRN
jgi:hypothetical protein